MRELVRARSLDGILYSVRSLQWDFAKVEKYQAQIMQFPIFSDGMDKTTEGFLNFVITGGALWFEIAEVETEKVVGLMYLTDMTADTSGKFLEASWHAMLWDAKSGPRRPVLRAAIKAIFDVFQFHRLRVEIPMHFGGVIRQAVKLGFVEEGRLRKAKQYHGEWFDVLVASILEEEAAEWVV